MTISACNYAALRLNEHAWGYDLNEINITPTLKKTAADAEDEYAAFAESFLHSLAQQAALDDDKARVAALASATASISELFPDEQYDFIHCCFEVELGPSQFAEIKPKRRRFEKDLRSELAPIWSTHMPHHLQLKSVSVGPKIESKPDWRAEAKTFLFDGGINNQGRGHSENPAMLEEGGLYFRSQPEINLYYALKSTGLPFAPLPVFIKGGKSYRRIECDFIVLFEGLMFAVEVDGDAFHDERPVDAHHRVSMLTEQGAIELRVEARRCGTRSDAKRCAQNLIRKMKKHKKSRS